MHPGAGEERDRRGRPGPRHRLRAAVVVVVAVAAVLAVGTLSRPPAPDTAHPDPLALPSASDRIEVASGTVAGVDWSLEAFRRGRGVCVEIRGPSTRGSRCRPPLPAERPLDVRAGRWWDGGDPASLPWVAGQVSADVARVVLVLADGSELDLEPVEAHGARVVGLALAPEEVPVELRAFAADRRLLRTHVFSGEPVPPPAHAGGP